MRPDQLRTQCVHIWEQDIGFLHLLQCPDRKTFTKILSQSTGNSCSMGFPITGLHISVPFMSYDDPTNLPMRLYRCKTDGAISADSQVCPSHYLLKNS